MGLVNKGINEKQRKRMRYMSMKDRMEGQANIDKNPPTRDEVTCPSCGFKARYQFIRCPECNKLREEEAKQTVNEGEQATEMMNDKKTSI